MRTQVWRNDRSRQSWPGRQACSRYRRYGRFNKKSQVNLLCSGQMHRKIDLWSRLSLNWESPRTTTMRKTELAPPQQQF